MVVIFLGLSVLAKRRGPNTENSTVWHFCHQRKTTTGNGGPHISYYESTWHSLAIFWHCIDRKKVPIARLNDTLLLWRHRYLLKNSCRLRITVKLSDIINDRNSRSVAFSSHKLVLHSNGVLYKKENKSYKHAWGNVLCSTRIFDAIMHLTWLRHQMETISALLARCAGNSPVTGEFPQQRPVTRGFWYFRFDLRLNKRCGEHSWGWWFDMSSCPLWRRCNGSSVTELTLG